MNPDCLAPDRGFTPPSRRPLFVALVTETYPPEVNGVAMTVARVAEGLRARRHRVQVVRPWQALADTARTPGLDEVLVKGVPVPRYPHLKMGLPCTRRLVAQWRHARPDIVHIATEGPLGWSALRAAQRLGLPVTSDFRTNFQAYSRHYGLGWLSQAILAYLRRFHNATRCTMVPTEALRDELEALGFAPVRAVARGVDASRFHPQHRSAQLRASWGATDQTLVMLHVGRLAAEKNLGALLDSYEKIRQLRPDSRLVLVGDGPSRADLERRCPGAVFAGMRTGHELAEHYASGDLFVFPSTTETFGNVTLEAMASGLPVVAYHYAAAAQVVTPQVNGWLVPMGADASFVAASQEAAGDLARLRAMGLAARQVAQARHWDRILDQIEATFSHAMGSAPPQAEVYAAVQPGT